MTISERVEFRARIRKYLQSGKLSADSFNDMTLLFSVLGDNSLTGDSIECLRPYEEPDSGWRRVFEEIQQ